MSEFHQAACCIENVLLYKAIYRWVEIGVLYTQTWTRKPLIVCKETHAWTCKHNIAYFWETDRKYIRNNPRNGILFQPMNNFSSGCYLGVQCPCLGFSRWNQGMEVIRHLISLWTVIQRWQCAMDPKGWPSAEVFPLLRWESRTATWMFQNTCSDTRRKTQTWNNKTHSEKKLIDSTRRLYNLLKGTNGRHWWRSAECQVTEILQCLDRINCTNWEMAAQLQEK